MRKINCPLCNVTIRIPDLKSDSKTTKSLNNLTDIEKYKEKIAKLEEEIQILKMKVKCYKDMLL